MKIKFTLLMIAMMMSAAVGQDLRDFKEVNAEVASQFSWKNAEEMREVSLVIPHYVSVYFSNIGRYCWTVFDYLYLGYYFERATLEVDAGHISGLNLVRWVDIKKQKIPALIGLEKRYDLSNLDDRDRLNFTPTSFTENTFLFGQLGLVEFKTSLNENSRDPFPMNSLQNLDEEIRLEQVDRGEILPIYTNHSSYGDQTPRKATTEIFIVQSDREMEIARQQKESNSFKRMTYSVPLSNIGPAKYYLSTDCSKLILKFQDRYFTFNNQYTGKFTVHENVGFQPQLIEEVKIMLLHLQKLKPSLRPAVFEQTYGQLQNSLLSLRKMMEESKSNHLQPEVQNRYESIFFLYKSILLREINKDREVLSYGPLVRELCGHLEYCNNSFFQFDPGAPSSAVISMIAKHVSMMFEKSKVMLSKHRLPKASELRPLIDGLFTQSFELSVAQVLGDADVGLLNQLDELLDSYQKSRVKLEQGLSAHSEAQMVYEQINLGMGFLRKIRE